MPLIAYTYLDYPLKHFTAASLTGMAIEGWILDTALLYISYFMIAGQTL